MVVRQLEQVTGEHRPADPVQGITAAHRRDRTYGDRSRTWRIAVVNDELGKAHRQQQPHRLA